MLDDCVTAELTCGDRVIGHTVGGVQRYDTRFYEAKHCWPATIDHDGGEERVYKLRMPSGEWRAWVTLYTPCADLDVAAIRFDGDTCPTLGSNTGACEMVPEPHTTSERIELTTQTRNGLEPTWWIVVEGKDTPGSQPEGAFELHVQCAPGLGGPVDPAKLITTSRE